VYAFSLQILKAALKKKKTWLKAKRKFQVPIIKEMFHSTNYKRQYKKEKSTVKREMNDTFSRSIFVPSLSTRLIAASIRPYTCSINHSRYISDIKLKFHAKLIFIYD
jgi:hypothetical protein